VGQDCQNHACVTQTQSEAPAPAAPTPVAGQCEIAPVYFDFDASTLADSARSELQRDAQCIKERGIKSVHITGMTDPRGTEEYNLALGDRRAQSAQQYMKTLATDATLSYSSMGEEQATGTDEGSWAMDRRVEIRAK
jgi:peptidoglycan-associated lipoprotein